MLRYLITVAAAIVACAAAIGSAHTEREAGDPVIESARNAAAAFARSSPDFIVKRTTTRYRGTRQGSGPCGFGPDPKAVRPAGGFPSETVENWRVVDVVTGDMTSRHGSEVYANIGVNGKPAKSLPNAGIWTAGEFSSALLGILAPNSAALFAHRRPDPIRNHPANRYDFGIDRSHSTWLLQAEFQRQMRSPRYITAYDGAIWIDRDTGQTLRIERSARGVPPVDFPLNMIDSAIDYDFVRIGDKTYVLPIHSETFTCPECGSSCLGNETVFRDYNKFGSNTSITFEGSAK